MTSYSRLEENRPWEQKMDERAWLYQTPMNILIKASNGAYLTKIWTAFNYWFCFDFHYEEDARKLGFDKVIMQAGGIGYGKVDQAKKDTPKWR